jgi:site-specific recombinase XerD
MIELSPVNRALRTFAGELPLPALITEAGGHAEAMYVEFFTARIRNPNTRRSYATAASQFLAWCVSHGLSLRELTPTIVATYIEALQRVKSPTTVKQHLAALRMLMDHLVITRVLATNPSHAVRGLRYSISKGKTPVLTAGEARQLLDAIETTTLIGLRDRAFIGLMVYSFARIGAVVGMNVEDYYPMGKRWRIRLHEKNGKDHEVPCHHNAEAYLDAYLTAAGIGGDPKTPLFRTIDGRRGTVTPNRMDRRDALERVKRRAITAGLTARATNHTFRATGITTYLLNGGTLEHAQAIAAHSSTSTTKLYDRRRDELTLDEIERIVI